jgi:hypothetical protein
LFGSHGRQSRKREEEEEEEEEEQQQQAMKSWQGTLALDHKVVGIAMRGLRRSQHREEEEEECVAERRRRRSAWRRLKSSK